MRVRRWDDTIVESEERALGSNMRVREPGPK